MIPVGEAAEPADILDSLKIFTRFTVPSSGIAGQGGGKQGVLHRSGKKMASQAVRSWDPVARWLQAVDEPRRGDLLLLRESPDPRPSASP